MWKNTVQQDTLQTTVWRMRIACWKPKSTDTHSEYAICIAFPLQQWLQKRASLLRYTARTLSVLSVLFCKWCGDHSGGYINFIVNLDTHASWPASHVLVPSNTQTLKLPRIYYIIMYCMHPCSFCYR
jgi:hypothetical protein